MNRQERAQELGLQLEVAFSDLEADLARGYTARYLEVLAFSQRFWRYSIANTMLIAMQRPDATRCAGLKT